MVGGVVVGNESVLGNHCKRGRQLSNKPLQRMKAASSRSTVNEPWPRGSSDERRPPRGHGSATIDQPGRPSPLNGKALDRLGGFEGFGSRHQRRLWKIVVCVRGSHRTDNAQVEPPGAGTWVDDRG